MFDSLPDFEDPRVQVVYKLLCDLTEPPGDEHWEGFVARRIVAAIGDSVTVGLPEAQKTL